MSLQLSITKYPSSELVTKLSHCFDQNGGSIGRAEKNDWVLPDKERYVSSSHAEIRFIEGRYELIDKSTNGVYLNSSEDAIGAEQPVELRNGDSLLIGGYEIQVNLMLAETSFDELGAEGVDGEEDISNALSVAPAVTETDLTEEPDFEQAEHDQAKVEKEAELDDLDRWLEPDNNASPPWEGEGGKGDAAEIPSAVTVEPGLIGSDVTGSGLIETGQKSGENNLLDIVNASAQELDPLALLDSAAGDDWQGASQSQSVDPINEPLQLGGLIPDDWDDEPLLEAPVEAVASVVEGLPLAEDLAEDIPPLEKPPIIAESTTRESGFIVEDSFEAKGTSPITDSIDTSIPSTEATFTEATSIAQSLGINVNDLSSQQLSDFNQVVADVVRESVSGLMEVLGARAAIKNEFRMEGTLIQPSENNPLKFSVNLDEALDNLFVRQSNAYMESIESVRDGFQDIKNHQLAMLTGMRAAFHAMFGKFDPEKMQEKFESDGVGGLTAAGRKAKYWDAYSKLYQSWANDQDRVFNDLFGDDFVEAYEEQMDLSKQE
ncbi:MAG: type VI secretion system-associated FHA domain protein TagH [Pseudomonadales bacterium]|nr:type VI secretion system-associated FHA domain protein TagH [Pseudomonadales bacterium]